MANVHREGRAKLNSSEKRGRSRYALSSHLVLEKLLLHFALILANFVDLKELNEFPREVSVFSFLGTSRSRSTTLVLQRPLHWDNQIIN